MFKKKNLLINILEQTKVNLLTKLDLSKTNKKKTLFFLSLQDTFLFNNFNLLHVFHVPRLLLFLLKLLKNLIEKLNSQKIFSTQQKKVIV